MIFYQRTGSFFFFGLIFVEQKGTLFFPFKVSLPLSMCSDFFLFLSLEKMLFTAIIRIGVWFILACRARNFLITCIL